MKVLHLPSSVGGVAWGLSQAERAIGIYSRVVDTYPTYLGYSSDFQLYAKNKFECTTVYRFPYLLYHLIKYVNEFNVFHLNSGASLLDFPDRWLHLIDLPLLKKKGKVIVTFNGCELRLKKYVSDNYLHSACSNSLCGLNYCSPQRESVKLKRVKKVEKYAHQIFAATPDLLDFLPEGSEYLPGVISNWNKINCPPFVRNKSDPITIIHAPTNRIVKGTEFIDTALLELKNEYKEKLNIVYVEKMPHKEAILAYQKSDLVIDQILIGWYGNLAIETMKMGKPVVAYIREDCYDRISKKMASDCKETIINSNPDTLSDNIRYILDNPEILNQLSKRSIDYVNNWHDPIKIANSLKKKYEE